MAGLFVFAVHIYLTPGCILLTFDFVLTVSENNIIHVLKNICKNVTMYARIIQILSKYLSELIGFWMWPQSQCAAHHQSNIWGQLSRRELWGGGYRTWTTWTDELYELYEPAAHSSFPPSIWHSPALRFPHYVVTGSGQSSLSIFSPLFDRSFSPLWLGEICLRNGGCDVCQGLTQHFT